MGIKQTTMVLSNGGMYTLQGMAFEDAISRWHDYLNTATDKATVAWPTDDSAEVVVRLKDIVGFMRQNDMHLVPN